MVGVSFGMHVGCPSGLGGCELCVAAGGEWLGGSAGWRSAPVLDGVVGAAGQHLDDVAPAGAVLAHAVAGIVRRTRRRLVPATTAIIAAPEIAEPLHTAHRCGRAGPARPRQPEQHAASVRRALNDVATMSERCLNVVLTMS